MNPIMLAAAILHAGVAVISHRGEHLRHPENTMPAYRAAFEAGADFIEVDVRTTADGRLVIMHDAAADRATDGRGEIAAMTFEQVRGLDAGARMGAEFRGTRVPLLDEVLEFARGKIGVYIDAKRVTAAALVAAVRAAAMQEHVVVYGNPQLLRAVQALEPRMRIMPEAGSLQNATTLLRELHPPVMAFNARDFQDEILAPVRQAHIGVFVDRLGAADTPESWEDAVRRGATGIQTDHPAELVRFLRARNLHR